MINKTNMKLLFIFSEQNIGKQELRARKKRYSKEQVSKKRKEFEEDPN